MKSVSTLQSVAEENREKLTQLENHIRSCYQSQKDGIYLPKNVLSQL